MSTKDIQTMADMLRRGATLTDLTCPVCSSPLFRLKSGKLWCARCKKQVVVVREGEHVSKAVSPVLLSDLETTLLTKIEGVRRMIEEEKDINQLQKLNMVLSTMLENLEKVKKVKE